MIKKTAATNGPVEHYYRGVHKRPGGRYGALITNPALLPPEALELSPSIYSSSGHAVVVPMFMYHPAAPLPPEVLDLSHSSYYGGHVAARLNFMYHPGVINNDILNNVNMSYETSVGDSSNSVYLGGDSVSLSNEHHICYFSYPIRGVDIVLALSSSWCYWALYYARASKVSHFEILCRVHGFQPSVNCFRMFYTSSYSKGWMSFVKHFDGAPVCHCKPLDSVKNWNDHFF
ncbi:hypothetical protein Tco_0890500 [Tanacetum coccineum]|uniref:Uncharacterized protein n=1 Tax=Tanacetum coccineum TaxID=301880 RepID=A0ABQ5C3F6_9ASTR